MNRTKFIKTGGYLSFGCFVTSSAFLASCKQGSVGTVQTVEAIEAVATPELFLFELFFNYAIDNIVGEAITSSCEAVTHNSALCSQISAMFVALKGGAKFSKEKGAFNWTFEDVPKNTLKVALNSMDDALDIAHNVSNSKAETDDCSANRGAATYQSGIGKYPLASTMLFCNNYECVYPLVQEISEPYKRRHSSK